MYRYLAKPEPMGGTDYEPERQCPIKLDLIHCPSCQFNHDGCKFKEMTEHPQCRCATCGAPTYEEFKATGKPHICKEERK